MKLYFNVKSNIIGEINEAEIEHKLAERFKEITEPYVPALTGVFSNSTMVTDNVISYNGVQAEYLWEGKAMVDSATGKGARYIPNVGFRFRRGATLMPSNRNLVFNTSYHPKATDHWALVSYDENHEQIAEYAKELVINEFK